MALSSKGKSSLETNFLKATRLARPVGISGLKQKDLVYTYNSLLKNIDSAKFIFILDDKMAEMPFLGAISLHYNIPFFRLCEDEANEVRTIIPALKLKKNLHTQYMAKRAAAAKKNLEQEASEERVEVSEEAKKELNEIVEQSTESEGSASSGTVSLEEESGSGSSNEEEGDNSEALTVFIKGIDYDNREEDIRGQMEKIGSVKRVNVPLAYGGRRNKGFAYVEFEKKSDVEKALKLNGTILLGKKVLVDKARPRENFKLYTVFCKNLNYGTTKTEMKEYFSKYGQVYNVSLPMSQEDENRNRGFCFVEFKDEDIVKKILDDDHVINNRKVIVTLGRKNEDRNARRSSDRLYGRRNDKREFNGDDRDGREKRYNRTEFKDNE